jgi:hypothetical protein
MSESVTPLDGPAADLVSVDAPPIAGALERAPDPALDPATEPTKAPRPPAVEGIVDPTPLTSGTPATPETEALLEILRRGLAVSADPAARRMAHEVSGRVLHALAPAPAPPPLPSLPPAPVGASPLAAIVGSLRNVPPDQLLSLALQRLRAALPAGAIVAEPKGIQFSLVPVVPVTAAGGAR